MQGAARWLRVPPGLSPRLSPLPVARFRPPPRARAAAPALHLVGRLRRGGWRLLDAQFLTGHLRQFGAVETPQAAYLRLLRVARSVQPNVRSLFEPMAGAEAVFYALQPTTQAS